MQLQLIVNLLERFLFLASLFYVRDCVVVLLIIDYPVINLYPLARER